MGILNQPVFNEFIAFDIVVYSEYKQSRNFMIASKILKALQGFNWFSLFVNVFIKYLFLVGQAGQKYNICTLQPQFITQH